MHPIVFSFPLQETMPLCWAYVKSRTLTNELWPSTTCNTCFIFSSRNRFEGSDEVNNSKRKILSSSCPINVFYLLIFYLFNTLDLPSVFSTTILSTLIFCIILVAQQVFAEKLRQNSKLLIFSGFVGSLLFFFFIIVCLNLWKVKNFALHIIK